jgi:hypothetical protein
MPDKNKIFMGLQSHNILKRSLEGDYGKLRSTQEFFLLSYGVFDWLSIDLKGGCGNIRQRSPGSDRLSYPTFMGGGYGFRLKVYGQERIKTVVGFQHISIHPRRIYVGSVKHKAVLDDWQVSALASYDFKSVTPYLGVKWSRCDYIHWQDGERNRVKSASGKSVGLALGLDIPFAKQFWVNLEGQFIDTEACSFSLNYGF